MALRLSCSGQVRAIKPSESNHLLGATARVQGWFEPGRPRRAQLAAALPPRDPLQISRVPPPPGMSRRMGPGGAPWSKLKRAVREGVPTGRRLGREGARQLCAELVPAIPGSSPPPAVSGEDKTPSRRPAGRRRSRLELERMIGERYQSGDLGPEEALHLFDELLPKATRASASALNQLLTVVANAPASSSVSNGPALAISLFNRMAQAGASKVAPTIYTYSILIDSCCQAGRLDLAFASLALVIKTGWRVNAITFTPLLSALCREKRTGDAVDMVLRRMPELGCTPNVFSYSTLLKGFCNEKKSQEALELLHMMTSDESKDKCTPNVVSYTTVIDGFFKEGKEAKAYGVFRDMLDRGISPNVVTYSSVIDGLCKAQAMHLAGEVLQQMLDRGVIPNTTTYTALISGYCSSGWWKKAVTVLKQMSRDGHRPDVVTYNMLMDCLCKNGRFAEARNIFDYMAVNGPKPDITTYTILLHGYGTKGDLVEMNHLIDLMVQNGMPPNHRVFNILISVYAKYGLVEGAMLMFEEMRQHGLDPDVFSYTAIMHGYCLADRMDEAMKLMDAMVSIGLKPDDVTYNILINGFCKSGRLHDALTLFSQMLSKGVNLDSISYQRTWQALFETVATAAGLLQRND